MWFVVLWIEWTRADRSAEAVSRDPVTADGGSDGDMDMEHGDGRDG